jgi:hypothetical protein
MRNETELEAFLEFTENLEVNKDNISKLLIEFEENIVVERALTFRLKDGEKK